MIRISCIPPNTAMRGAVPPTKGRYYKKTYTSPMKIPEFSTESLDTREVCFDVFHEEDNELKVVGNLSGIVNNDDVIVSIDGNTLYLVTKPSANKKYEATIKLPEGFQTVIKDKSIRNGIMTLILEQVKFEEVPDELLTVFNKCLESYQEIENVELRIVKSRRNGTRDSLDGAKGKANDKNIIILFVPDKLWGLWEALRPIIHHELSHFINLEDPDKVFYERADKKSIQLWEMLKKDNLVDCKVEV